MKHAELNFRTGFRIATGNERSQAAVMVIAAGGREGGPDNRHKGADQWLYVTEGTGEAIINNESVALSAGSIILIERGETHEIRNTGRSLLKTVNIYVPPAYTDDGDERPAGRSM